jgi:anti-sigma factor RsiW
MNMNCEQVHAYHDGELSPEQRAAFEAHSRSCPQCQQTLAELKGLSNLFDQVPLAELSPRTMSRMYGAFHAARAQQERGVRKLSAWMTAAAAAVLAFAFVRHPAAIRPSDDAPGQTSGWPEMVAVMPPLEPRNGSTAELVQFAQWSANDLSNGETR